MCLWTIKKYLYKKLKIANRSFKPQNPPLNTVSTSLGRNYENPLGPNYKTQGFTLIELLITVLVLVTITALAVPSYNAALQSWEAKEIRGQIIDAFRVAKTYSYRHHQNTIMCLADANYQCHKQGKDFLLIFTDTDDNHQFNVSNNQMILQQPLQLDYGRLYLRAGGRHYIKFFGDSGLPRGHFGHIKYCSNDRRTHNMFQISLNQQGIHRFKTYDYQKTNCPSPTF